MSGFAAGMEAFQSFVTMVSTDELNRILQITNNEMQRRQQAIALARPSFQWVAPPQPPQPVALPAPPQQAQQAQQNKVNKASVKRDENETDDERDEEARDEVISVRVCDSEECDEDWCIFK